MGGISKIFSTTICEFDDNMQLAVNIFFGQHYFSASRVQEMDRMA